VPKTCSNRANARRDTKSRRMENGRATKSRDSVTPVAAVSKVVAKHTIAPVVQTPRGLHAIPPEALSRLSNDNNNAGYAPTSQLYFLWPPAFPYLYDPPRAPASFMAFHLHLASFPSRYLQSSAATALPALLTNITSINDFAPRNSQQGSCGLLHPNFHAKLLCLSWI